jgi:hypothetical protein
MVPPGRREAPPDDRLRTRPGISRFDAFASLRNDSQPTSSAQRRTIVSMPFAPAAQCARVVNFRPAGVARPSREGAGDPKRAREECRVRGAPTASCAHGSDRCTRVFTASSPESPGIPARNGFTVYFVISPAIGCFATVALRMKVLSGPVQPNEPPQDLTPASSRQDHTT